MTKEEPIRGRAAVAMLALAAAYGLVLLVVFGTRHGGVAYAIFAQPLAVTALLYVLLHAHCTTGDRLSGLAAAVIAALYLVWSVLGALSLAAGSFPAAVALAAAVALTPAGGQSAERRVSCSASRLV